MKFLTLVGSLGLVFGMASAARGQWLDDFDSYATGPLCAQSAWDEWTGSSGVDATVDSTRSFTSPNSVMSVTSNDVVYDFANLSGGRPSSGVWSASIKTYLPFGTTGTAWYILMNDYPTNLQWSVQTTFDTAAGRVKDGAGKTKIKFDQWVSLVVAIDLDNNRYDSWYGDNPVAVNHPWYVAGSGGQAVIAANDLYGDAGGLSGIWWDNPRLDQAAGGPLVLTSTPNPIAGGQTLKLYSNSPVVSAGDLGLLFSWTVNGSFFILPLTFASYDSTGTWTISASVPYGFSGLELGLKMFADPTGGKLLESNEDVIVFL